LTSSGSGESPPGLGLSLVSAAIEEYAAGHTSARGPELEALARETRQTLASPRMLSGPIEGRLLEMLVFVSGARRVLEIGTFSGYSALSMAEGLAPGGHIITCEVSPEHAEVARRHIAAGPHAGRIEVIVGRALEIIGGLDGPFDLVFLDADKSGYEDYYEAALAKLAPRGLIVADNTLWGGRVLDADGADEDTAALIRFNDRVAADSRVSCVMLTVRDGITLIRRRDGDGVGGVVTPPP